MSFGVNVRDNQLNGGQTASKETTLTFDANAGPFIVTSQTITETWNGGTSKLINWDVANTDLSPVNCTLVNILIKYSLLKRLIQNSIKLKIYVL